MANKFLKKKSFTRSGLYYTNIKPIQLVAYKIIFQHVDAFQTWHDRFGHPRTGTMSKIIGYSIGHAIKNVKFPLSKDFCSIACAVGKLILRPSYLKIKAKPLYLCHHVLRSFDRHIPTRWSHMCLLSVHNHAFSKMMS